MLFKSATSRNMALIAGSGLIATVAATGLLLSFAYDNIRDASITEMRQIAGSYAADIERSMSTGVELTANLRSGLTAMKKGGDADRARADLLLKTVLEDSPSVLGTWTGWEPNAFDGKDADFVGKEGHDATGRYVPYWVRNSGKISHQALIDYTIPGNGDYYQLAFTQRKTVIVEPYLYDIGGEKVAMTSIATLILWEGKAVGVAGMDISLAETHKTLSAVKPMGTGFLGLVTGAGVIVSHPDSGLTAKSIKDAGDKTAAWGDLIAHPGDAVQTAGADGAPLISVAMPVKLTPDLNWYAIVSVPKATVFAKLYDILWTAALVTGATALLLGLAVWFIARKFTRRIDNIIRETRQIAGGDIHVALKDADARDELGDLARSLGILLDSNRRKITLEQEAEANRDREEQERQQRSVSHAAREEAIRFAVAELGHGLAKLSDGDMTVRLEKPFSEALDEIRKDFNVSVEKLQAALLSFSQNAATIQAGSEEIRAAADDLARRTEQQAASVEQTAAALEEITTSVKDSTLRAEEAGLRVARTKQGAEHSGEIVRNAVAAMSAIEESSQSISNIIGVIDDIAFQTNLLALNAGVEAARAGEAGKGFAVVAQEVRELAQRSAQAAKEIKSLITSSGGQVKHGVGLVGETGDALRNIVAEVQEIDRHVQAIVQSAREQSVGLQEINTAVNQMDQGTQRNASMVEETNAASHTLVSEVTALSARLAQFNLGAGHAAAPRLQASGGGTSFAAAPVSRAAAPRPAPARDAASGPRSAPGNARPVTSPAHALTGKLTAAFGGAPSASDSSWEEF